MEDLVTQLARETEQRYYGKYRGFVADNDDPDRRGRLRLTVPSVLGQQTTAWALPCFPFGGSAGSGFFVVPEVGAEVWVEFEMGDRDRPIWVGTFTSGQPHPGGDDLGPWHTRAWRTVGGQLVRLDDAEGATGVTVKHHTGAMVEIADDGTLTVTDNKGEKITLDASGTRLLVQDANGNQVQLTSSGVSISDAAGNKVELAAAGVTVKGSTVVVEGGIVNLGGQGGEPVIKGSSFLSAYMLHTHPTAAPGAPTLPPVPTSEMSSLSAKVTTL